MEGRQKERMRARMGWDAFLNVVLVLGGGSGLRYFFIWVFERDVSSKRRIE